MQKKILITDDTKTWLYFHQETIKELYNDTFDIQMCDSAVQAYNLVQRNKTNPFDIIITDLQMEDSHEPQTAGEWLINHIKKTDEYSTTKIIIISAMSNIEDIAKKLNVECISKQRLINNKLLLKYMFEKLMPYLSSTI